MIKRILTTILLVLCLTTLVACTKDATEDSGNSSNGSGSGSGSKGDSNGGSNNGSDVSGRVYMSDCGIVVGGELSNPTNASSGIRGTAEVIGPNRFIFTPESAKSSGGDEHFVAKLLSIDNITGPRSDVAQAKLELYLRGTILFFEAEKDCVTVDAGSSVRVGNVISTGGLNVVETLIKDGTIPTVDVADECKGELVGSCLESLRAASEVVGDEVSKFLWKPTSDSDGNLVITFSPYARSVTVNGQSGRLIGPGNGRATTARFPRPGCAYPAGSKVEALDRNGRNLLFKGQPFFSVGSPCSRIEF